MAKNLIANRYEAFQHIGQGGMADVFLAVDTILNRQVAIKILRSELCTDAVSVLRFEREAQAATALSHPNIVEIYDVGEYKGHHFIVMEYVSGKTLKQVIRDRGGLLTSEAVDIMKQLTSATAEAHRRGIIHRDIKPQNVIVKADGTVKILDFGIALAKGGIQLTQANNVMGSVHYLAPELAKGEAASAQSDIYALGIVLYEMLTSDVPFKADSAVQVALMQMRNSLPDCKAINPAIPQSVANIVTKATAKDKDNRYHSCNEMLEDLSTCLLPQRKNEPKLVLRSAAVRQQYSAHSVNSGNPAGKDQKSYRVEPAPIRQNEDKPGAPAVVYKKKQRLRNRLLIGFLFLLLTLLASSGIYFALSLSGLLTPRSRYVSVPELTGMTLNEAKNKCAELDLVLDTSNVTYTLTENTEKGKIISSQPEANAEAEKGSRISVSVSSGIYAVAENFVGQNINDVQEKIKSATEGSPYKNLVVSVLEEASEGITPGQIIRQELLEPEARYNPAAKTEVRLIYASYPTIVIPGSIEKVPVDEAVRILEEKGAKVLTSNLDYSTLPADQVEHLEFGIVIKTDPEIGSEYTQKENNYITIYFY